MPMTPEEKALLEQTRALVEDSNKMLKSMRRSARMSSIFHIFYWIVILALTVGSYYLLEPNLKKVSTLISSDPQLVDNALQQAKSMLQKQPQ